jgi:hypothetical protein
MREEIIHIEKEKEVPFLGQLLFCYSIIYFCIILENGIVYLCLKSIKVLKVHAEGIEGRGVERVNIYLLVCICVMLVRFYLVLATCSKSVHSLLPRPLFFLSSVENW